MLRMMRPRLITWLIMGDQGMMHGEIHEKTGMLSVVIQTIGELSQEIDGGEPIRELPSRQNLE